MEKSVSCTPLLNKLLLQQIIKTEVLPMICVQNGDKKLFDDYEKNLAKSIKDMQISVDKCTSEVKDLRQHMVNILEKYSLQSDIKKLPIPMPSQVIYEPRSKWIYVSGFLEHITASDLKNMLKRRWSNVEFEIYKLIHESHYPYASFKIGTDDLTLYDVLKIGDWPSILKITEYFPTIEDLQGLVTPHSDYSGSRGTYPPNPTDIPIMGPQQQFYDAKGKYIDISTFNEGPDEINVNISD